MDTLFLLFALVFGYGVTGYANTLSGISYQEKTLQIWGQEVKYQYLVKENPKVDFDGEVYIKIEKGREIYQVVINPAFFEKEAKGLFKKFSVEKEIDGSDDLAISNEELFHLEKQLLGMNHAGIALKKGSLETQKELKKIQQGLERLAWYRIFEDCHKNARSAQEAEKNFIREFTKERIRTIEHHEAAHVLDLKKAEGDTSNADFTRFTELNAFYTELTFASNPLDVMAQAISGLIDELHRGKPVDHSVEKVATVVRFLKKCPRFASRLSGGKMPRCCLEILGELSQQDFIFAAKQLYRNNHHETKSILVSLR